MAQLQLSGSWQILLLVLLLGWHVTRRAGIRAMLNAAALSHTELSICSCSVDVCSRLHIATS